ncbi:unnamed protein product [Prorocentrum cordatum]|uniref:Palmitoyltransferase n=1 Tax=Prorocentrum cordatum TaxID=2364126 RepID=A0ABN9VM57_9DINO|nr:unnamed protein product [Polarella glacialis]
MRQRPPACLDLATLRPLAPRTEGRSCQGSLLRVPERSLPRWCWACQGPKPARAHHCRVCGRCVLKMDHHCPWVNNCVGAHNYRYFCLFLLYLAQGCLFVLVVFPYGFTTWGFWGSAAEDDAVVRSFHPAACRGQSRYCLVLLASRASPARLSRGHWVVVVGRGPLCQAF